MTDNDIIQFTPCPDSDSKAHPSEMKREYEEIVQLTPVPTQNSDETEDCDLEDAKLLELPPIDEMEEILKLEEPEETPLFTPPHAPTTTTNRNRGLAVCPGSAISALQTKQDTIWIEDPSGQWALDFDYDQPNVRIASIDYVDGAWKAKGLFNGAELTWIGPVEESASTGQFTDPTSVAPAFTASRIIPIPARATQSDVESPNEKRIATMAALRNAINNSDIKDLPKKIAYTTDSTGRLTALTIGSRASGAVGAGSLVNGANCSAQGVYAHAEGDMCSATADYAHAEGVKTKASGIYSHAEGKSSTSSGLYAYANGDWAFANGDYSFALGYKVKTGDDRESGKRAFAWNGDVNIENYFSSHGEGSFNINPKNGILGFYIGEKNLQDIIDARIKELVKVSNPEPTI